jgi:hypothetical protein
MRLTPDNGLPKLEAPPPDLRRDRAGETSRVWGAHLSSLRFLSTCRVRIAMSRTTFPTTRLRGRQECEGDFATGNDPYGRQGIIGVLLPQIPVSA